MAKTKINDEEEFPANSRASKSAPMREGRVARTEVDDTPKPRRRVAQGLAIKRKRTFAQSVAEAISGGSEGVGGYILTEVLIPAAKSTIKEMITSAMEMVLFGEAGSRGRDRDRGGSSRVSYNKYYRGDEERKSRPAYKDKFDLDEIFFKNGAEAAEVLDEMCDILEEFGQVTVADYFDLAGIEATSWAHNKYGWEDLRKARCTHTRNGYAIILPKAIELD
jgi:hypothetical protein